MRRLLRAVLSEPLVHFLVLGALIFAANALIHPATAIDPYRIDISRADIERMRALYAQQWGAPPEAGDMPRLLENYIRSEVLFHEGMSLGLDSDDSVVRNRVVQKMEFLLQDPSAVQPPTDDQIAAYFAAHTAIYSVPEQVSFAQIYFSPERRGDHAAADALATLTSLKDPHAANGLDMSKRGDPFMMEGEESRRTKSDLEKDLGSAFAAALFALPVGSWQGPLTSTLGTHLVLVREHVPAHPRPISEVRDRVHDDLVAEQLQTATDAAFARIRARYHVRIAPDAGVSSSPPAAVQAAR